jgi:hypothetical protein
VPNSTNTSKSWCSHFVTNRLTADALPWADTYQLTSRERRAVARSIQQFQLGEGSNGKRLLKRGLAHARATRDPDFLRALYLFVKEEQRHSGYLLRFMQAQKMPALRHHRVDSVFRVLRGLAGLELSLRVLVTAEIVAVPYYRALRDATNSPLLKAMSTRILADEAAHLRFQSSMLSRLASHRWAATDKLVAKVHRVFLTGTSLIVWLGHSPVFLAAGYTRRQFLLEAHAELRLLAYETAQNRLPAMTSLLNRPSSHEG